MQNIGVMSKKQLEDILKQFPPTARIKRRDIIIQVRPAISEEVVLQAATIGRGMWHVRAMPGLLEAKVQ